MIRYFTPKPHAQTMHCPSLGNLLEPSLSIWRHTRQSTPSKSKGDDSTKGAFFIYRAFAVGSVVVAEWIYSYISLSRAAVVIESAQGFLNLLFVAWYMVMGTVSTSPLPFGLG